MTWLRRIRLTCWRSSTDGTNAGIVLDGFNPPSRSSRRSRQNSPRCARVRSCRRPSPRRSLHNRASISLKASSSSRGENSRVVALRKRLDIAGDKDNPLYDDAVRDAVKTFQTESDIGVDGNLGPNTLHALNGEQREVRRAPGDPVDTIIVNMERWRWMPRNLGNPHVMVNVPDFTLEPLQRRQGLLENQDRGRQAKPGNADGQCGDEIYHRQSDLERAAIDHRKRISAGA